MPCLNKYLLLTATALCITIESARSDVSSSPAESNKLSVEECQDQPVCIRNLRVYKHSDGIKWFGYLKLQDSFYSVSGTAPILDDNGVNLILVSQGFRTWNQTIPDPAIQIGSAALSGSGRENLYLYVQQDDHRRSVLLTNLKYFDRTQCLVGAMFEDIRVVDSCLQYLTSFDSGLCEYFGIYQDHDKKYRISVKPKDPEANYQILCKK